MKVLYFKTYLKDCFEIQYESLRFPIQNQNQGCQNKFAIVKEIKERVHQYNITLIDKGPQEVQPLNISQYMRYYTGTELGWPDSGVRGYTSRPEKPYTL